MLLRSFRQKHFFPKLQEKTRLFYDTVCNFIIVLFIYYIHCFNVFFHWLWTHWRRCLERFGAGAKTAAALTWTGTKRYQTLTFCIELILKISYNLCIIIFFIYYYFHFDHLRQYTAVMKWWSNNSFTLDWSQEVLQQWNIFYYQINYVAEKLNSKETTFTFKYDLISSVTQQVHKHTCTGNPAPTRPEDQKHTQRLKMTFCFSSRSFLLCLWIVILYFVSSSSLFATYCAIVALVLFLRGRWVLFPFSHHFV